MGEDTKVFILDSSGKTVRTTMQGQYMPALVKGCDVESGVMLCKVEFIKEIGAAQKVDFVVHSATLHADTLVKLSLDEEPRVDDILGSNHEFYLRIMALEKSWKVGADKALKEFGLKYEEAATPKTSVTVRLS